MGEGGRGGGRGGGRALGGEHDDSVAPQAAAAAAARERLAKRENSVGTEESRKRDLLGRINEAYAARGESRPLWIASRSADEMAAHLTAVRSAGSGPLPRAAGGS